MKLLSIVVNYYSAPLCINAVKSIVECTPAISFPGCALDQMVTVVVDNSQNPSQAKLLAQGFSRQWAKNADIQLLINRENAGFGKACNQAFELVDSDMVLLLNPDAQLSPDALSTMVKQLFSHPSIAAVAPRIFWDDAASFLLPPAMPPWLSAFLSTLNGDPFHARALTGRLWQAYALSYWQSTVPVYVSNLSGGAVLLKRSAVRDAGGLFDENFFLYYEDTDLFHRLKKRGYSLVMDPEAEAVHYYDQCGREVMAKKRHFFEQSQRFFYLKHRSLGVRICRLFGNFFNLLGKAYGTGGDVVTRIFNAPFSMRIPHGVGDRWLFEWSPDPFFLTAAGFLGRGGELALAEKQWRKLSPGKYFGRITPLNGKLWKTIFLEWNKKNDVC